MDKQSNNMDPGCEKLDIKELYTTIDEAKKEIERRRNDKKLIRKVEEFLGGDIPVPMKDSARAVLSRDIISPNNEFFHFWGMSELLNLPRLFLQYSDSKLVAKNYNKYCLGRLFFYNGNGRNGGEKVDSIKILDFNHCEGAKLKDIKIADDKCLVDFHHDILRLSVPEFNIDSIYDFSEWFNRNKGHDLNGGNYYLRYLALFLVHGVLFENFIVSKGEDEFTKNKIVPSFNKLQEIFGIKPLVVPLTSIEDEDQRYWWCYPGKLKKCVVNSFSASSKFIIQDTGVYGIGAFAKSEIKKGELIYQFSGEVITLSECLDRIESGEEDMTDPLQIGMESYLDLNETSRAFNHSCNPNACLKGDARLVALRDIGIGEEINYDYSLTVGPNIPESEWTMECKCGSGKCRKKIGNILTVDQEIVEKRFAEKKLLNYLQDWFGNKS